MPCLIFRTTNEGSSSLSQTSSQAAIIPGRGSVLGRQKRASITSPDVSTVCVQVFVQALGGGVCLSAWEIVCLYLSTLHVCVCFPSHSRLSLSPRMLVCRYMGRRGSILIFKPQEGHFSFSLFSSDCQKQKITGRTLIACSVPIFFFLI